MDNLDLIYLPAMFLLFLDWKMAGLLLLTAMAYLLFYQDLFYLNWVWSLPVILMAFGIIRRMIAWRVEWD